jgi:16S rRNA (uracil1498-N3)-methyltransferase
VLDRHEVDRELPLVLTLGVALPKGDRQRWLVEKAVELGVTRLAPLRTARGVAQPVDRAVERLRRTVIEASKQCGRNRLMEVLAPQELGDYLAGPSGEAARWIAHPGAAAPDLSAGDAPRASDAPHPVYLAVGPEGGFTPEEVELARAAGWRPVGFGPRTLRIETASVALAAFVAIGLWGRAGTGAR